MKPVYAKLGSLGFVNVGYIDDSLLCGDTKRECQENVFETTSLMKELGKQVFFPVLTVYNVTCHIEQQKKLKQSIQLLKQHFL
jgi:hypothetical protein